MTAVWRPQTRHICSAYHEIRGGAKSGYAANDKKKVKKNKKWYVFLLFYTAVALAGTGGRSVDASAEQSSKRHPQMPNTVDNCISATCKHTRR